MTLDLDHLDDAGLVEEAARHLAEPRAGAADSFVLHAPLELMARAALLRRVDPTRRGDARRRIVEVVAEHDAYEAVDVTACSTTHRSWNDPTSAAAWVTAAITAGDADGAEAAVAWLADHTTAAGLVTHLADTVVARTSAAGHGSIFLWLLPRVLAADPQAARLARPLVRELARHPDWELTWMEHRPDAGPGAATGDLTERLLDVRSADDPGSNFIHPTMSLVERTGLAADLLGPAMPGLTVAGARRHLLRVAAMSMLQDDPANAPYGWSHALTMPQAAIGVAGACRDPQRALAVAATFLLGFRATQLSTPLDPAWAPTPIPAADGFLTAGPDAAASVMWHADEADTHDLVTQVVTSAACHSDAHLAKYTLACLDAARDDPGGRRLYLSAAAYLAGWWAVDRGS
jgi:hypothetical protein